MATKVHALPKMGGAFVAFFCCGGIDDVAKGDSQQPGTWKSAQQTPQTLELQPTMQGRMTAALISYRKPGTLR